MRKRIIERLSEENIFNCQTLAYSDPIKLFLKTNFQLKTILDWIDQALLYNYVTDKVQVLRLIGIRGITELAALYELKGKHRNAVSQAVAQRLEIGIDELGNIIDNNYFDPHVDFIWDLQGEYAEYD